MITKGNIKRFVRELKADDFKKEMYLAQRRMNLYWQHRNNKDIKINFENK